MNTSTSESQTGSTHWNDDAMSCPIIIVFGVVPHQGLVNDPRKEKQPPCVQVLFLLQEAPYVFWGVKQQFHMGSYRLQYTQV
jgi:hypothetical protein